MQEEDSDHEEEINKRMNMYLNDHSKHISSANQSIQPDSKLGGLTDMTHHDKLDSQTRWKKLKELSKVHINQVVDDQIAEGQIDEKVWGPLLHKFAI